MNALLNRPIPMIPSYARASLHGRRPFFINYLDRKLNSDVSKTKFLNGLIQKSIDMLFSVQFSIDESKREFLRTNLIESVADNWEVIPGELEAHQLSGQKVRQMLEREHLDEANLEAEILHGAMALAASLNDVSSILKLVGKGATITYTSVYIGDPSIAAARSGAVEAIDYLLGNTPSRVKTTHGFKANEETWHREQAFAAGLSDHASVLQLILNPTPERPCIREALWGNRSYAIQGAIKGGHYNLVRSLWEDTGEDIEVWKRRTLEYAARSGSLTIVQELIEAGTPFIEGSEGYTRLSKLPLEIASIKGRYKIVEFLLEKGAGGNGTKQRNALHYAARYGRTEIVKLLLDDGADVNARGKEESLRPSTPLRCASRMLREGCGGTVEVLLRRGARFQTKTQRLKILRKAEKAGLVGLVSVLGEFGVVDNKSVEVFNSISRD
ncbi:ankyrin [Acephala macrosclerotiorum]|nr:ankyrin [Acephala macrosclerotiorum]